MRHCPDVSVIVPHLNDLPGLNRTLSSLILQNVPLGSFEVIVVDNNSVCSDYELHKTIHAYPQLALTLVFAAEQGAAIARNSGAAAATAPVLAFLDCDCSAAPNWIEAGSRLMGSWDAIGGPVQVSCSSNSISSPELFDMLFGFDVEKCWKKNRHLLTANLWVKVSAFKKVGPFRSWVSEDTEWCHRALDLGRKLDFSRELIVDHLALSCESRLKARWERITRETFLYKMQMGQSRVIWLARCIAVALSPLIHMVRVLRTTPSAPVAVRLGALKLLFSIRWFRAIWGVTLALRRRYGDASLFP